MKKFKIIRNILIIVIILIAVAYVCWMRSSKIGTSKTAKLYHKMSEVSNKEQKNITMEISYNNEKMKIVMVQATDNTEGKEINCIVHDNYDRIKKDPNSEGAVIYSVVTKDGESAYNVFPKEKRYNITYENKESHNSYDQWIMNNIIKISDCKYYTKGYEFVNGKLLYYEKFKEIGLQIYFDKDELVYMKSTEIDEAFDELDNALYTVKITYDDSYKKYTEIPKDYKGYIEKYNEETNETEYTEIK